MKISELYQKITYKLDFRFIYLILNPQNDFFFIFNSQVDPIFLKKYSLNFLLEHMYTSKRRFLRSKKTLLSSFFRFDPSEKI